MEEAVKPFVTVEGAGPFDTGKNVLPGRS